MIYVVVKRGVYIQEVYGPFNKPAAITTANTMAAADSDDYHVWSVEVLGLLGLSNPVHEATGPERVYEIK